MVVHGRGTLTVITPAPSGSRRSHGSTWPCRWPRRPSSCSTAPRCPLDPSAQCRLVTERVRANREEAPHGLPRDWLERRAAQRLQRSAICVREAQHQVIAERLAAEVNVDERGREAHHPAPRHVGPAGRDALEQRDQRGRRRPGLHVGPPSRASRYGGYAGSAVLSASWTAGMRHLVWGHGPALHLLRKPHGGGFATTTIDAAESPTLQGPSADFRNQLSRRSGPDPFRDRYGSPAAATSRACHAGRSRSSPPTRRARWRSGHGSHRCPPAVTPRPLRRSCPREPLAGSDQTPLSSLKGSARPRPSASWTSNS
jgi:hypothetical protein